MKSIQHQYTRHLVSLNFQSLAKLIFIAIFLFLTQAAAAQDLKITGYVRDEGGRGLRNTSIVYGKTKVVSTGNEGKFVLNLEGKSNNFDKNQLKVSLLKYALKEISFNKDAEELIVTMLDAKEYTGLLINEARQPMAGTIFFTSGAYTEKIASNSKGIFTIHVPKNIDISNSSGFKINEIITAPADIDLTTLSSGLNKITLTYRLPQKAGQVAENTTATNLASPEGIRAYSIVLDGSGTTVPNIEVTIDKVSYKTDAGGKITFKAVLKTYIEPTIDDYVVASYTVDGITAVVHIRKEGAQEVIKNSYTTSFSSISDELKRTKDLLSLKNVRIRAEIATIEEKLTSDKSINPEQKKQYTDVLEKLKETLAKSEAAYNQLQEQSNEVLLQMQVLVSSKQDSLKALKELANILEAKNQKIEEERALESASFRNKIIMFSFAILVFALAAVYLLILSRKLNKQKQELSQTLAQVSLQKTQIEIQNTQLYTQKEEIELKNVRLEDLDREKNSLMNIVAHDLKAPLNKVVGAAQLLPNLGELNEDQEEFVNMIKKVAFEGKKFIEDLLDINAIEQQKPESISWEKIPLKSFISSSIIGYKQQAENKKIQLHLDTQLDSTEIDADRSYLNRILDNLVSNAIKFSPNDKNIYITATESAKMISIAIKDEGPGISPEDQKKMFKKFQKLSARPTAGESSTGLGLSIIKTLVERLNGEISVSSELKQGTTFVVTLPKERNV